MAPRLRLVTALGGAALAVAAGVASCARDGAAPPRPAAEPLGRASSAISTCVRQVEPMAPAPVAAWTVLKVDGTVWQTPRTPAGEYVQVVTEQIVDLGDQVQALGDADGEATTSCAIKRDRSLWCWGENTCGTVGDGNLTPTPDPTEIVGLNDALVRKVAGVSMGRTVTCAVTTDGDLHCWGQNDRGQVGVGILSPGQPPTSCIPGPQRISGPANALERSVKKVATGQDHVCAITRAGDLYCWGSNEFGQAGGGALGTSITSPTQVALGLDKAIDVTAGAQATCVVVAASPAAVSGEVACFGRNSTGAGEGTLGLSTGEANRATPARLTWLGSQIARVDMGQRTGCALEANGKLSCWGWNDVGQVGDGTTQSRAPGAVPQDFGQGGTAVGVGAKATCAVRGSSAFCWGSSVLPDGKRTSVTRPAEIDFCHLTQDGGVAGGACDTAADCPDPAPVCQLGRCRRCRQDDECPADRPACQRDGTCAECSATNHVRCGGDTPTCDVDAGACSNACAKDEDCGGKGSGKVCDTSVGRCRDGCRGNGGNGCPTGTFCSSRTEELGFCRTGEPEDAGGGDGGSGPFSFASDCAIAGVPGGAGGAGLGWPWASFGSLGLAAALAFRRRRLYSGGWVPSTGRSRSPRSSRRSGSPPRSR